MDSHRLATQIWDLVDVLEAIPPKDWQEHSINDPKSAASLACGLRWIALHANQAVLELLYRKQ